MMDYGKIKKFSDENQRFNWIKSIHWYQLDNIGWFIDIEKEFGRNPRLALLFNAWFFNVLI